MSEKPFWEGKTLMEIQNLDKRVKVTMENGDVFIGKLVRRSRDADGMCSLSMQLDAHRTYLHVFSAESFDTQPVIPSYVDTVELLDDPEYERIDNIEDVCEGDVYVAADGNKYTVISLTQSNLYPLRVMICKGTDYALPRDCFSHALRRKPKLPDKPGLWFDKEDTVWHFDGLFLRQLNDIEEVWSVTHVTRFAPFRPAKAVEA